MKNLQTKKAKICFSDIQLIKHLQQANKCYKDSIETWQKDIFQCLRDSSVTDTEIIDNIQESDSIIASCNFIDVLINKFLNKSECPVNKQNYTSDIAMENQKTYIAKPVY